MNCPSFAARGLALARGSRPNKNLLWTLATMIDRAPALSHLLAVVAWSLVASAACGQPARVGEVHGALLVRDAAGQWQGLKQGDPVPADRLLVALPQAE